MFKWLKSVCLGLITGLWLIGWGLVMGLMVIWKGLWGQFRDIPPQGYW